MIVLLTGCQSSSNQKLNSGANTVNKYHLITPGLIEINSIRLNNPEYWSQLIDKTIVSWTKDGALLNEVVFNRIDAGRNLLGQKGDINTSFDFNPDMSMALIVEQFTDALTVSNSHHNIKLLDQKSLRISNFEATKFKISYDTTNNVNYSAWALFIKKHNQLITIFCSGTSRYYFPKLEKTYLQIINSAQII